MNKKNDAPELKIAGALDLSPAPESLPVKVADRYGHFVDGKLVPGRDDSLFPVYDPSKRAVLTRVAAADASEVDAAVKAARRAYDEVWGRMPGRERGKYLFRIARRIQERSRELAVLE